MSLPHSTTGPDVPTLTFGPMHVLLRRVIDAVGSLGWKNPSFDGTHHKRGPRSRGARFPPVPPGVCRSVRGILVGVTEVTT